MCTSSGPTLRWDSSSDSTCLQNQRGALLNNRGNPQDSPQAKFQQCVVEKVTRGDAVQVSSGDMQICPPLQRPRKEPVQASEQKVKALTTELTARFDPQVEVGDSWMAVR
jgi:hypothetical protein